MEFSDQTVFLVGGSRGIGAAIVRRFAAAGAKMIFTYVASADAAHQLAAETGAQALRADAGERDELIAAVRDAGPIDIFVYNAGLLEFGDPITDLAAVQFRMRLTGPASAHAAPLSSLRPVVSSASTPSRPTLSNLSIWRSTSSAWSARTSAASSTPFRTLRLLIRTM